MRVSTDTANIQLKFLAVAILVNVVDFDDKYIVSASGDRTIKVCKTINFPPHDFH